MAGRKDDSGVIRPDVQQSSNEIRKVSTECDEEYLSLPTPPYVGLKTNTMIDSPINEKIGASNEKGYTMTDVECWDTEKMSRDQLLDYCKRNSLPGKYDKQTRKRLIQTVTKHLLESLTQLMS